MLFYVMCYLLGGYVTAYYIRDEDDKKDGMKVKHLFWTIVLWPFILLFTIFTTDFWNKKIKF